MNNEIQSVPQTALNAAKFRQLGQRIAGDLLTEWVGKDRAGAAIGRISGALASAAACAKKPEEFYSCTPQSIGACIAISALTGIMPGVGATALAYLIPRRARKGEQPQLTYQLSHRGIAALARRSGQHLIAVPIGMGDVLDVNVDGDVQIVDRDIDDPPLEWDELRGVVVVVRELSTGLVVARGWCPKKLIEKRRQGSDSYQFAERKGNEWAKDSDPWHVWPIEMAMKTSLHYAISRGWAVIDDMESVKAISASEMADLPQRPQSVALDATQLFAGQPGPVTAGDFTDGTAALEERGAQNQPSDKADSEPKKKPKRGRPRKTEAPKNSDKTEKQADAKPQEAEQEAEPEKTEQVDTAASKREKELAGLRRLAAAYECPTEAIEEVVLAALDAEDPGKYVADRPWA